MPDIFTVTFASSLFLEAETFEWNFNRITDFLYFGGNYCRDRELVSPEISSQLRCPQILFQMRRSSREKHSLTTKQLWPLLPTCAHLAVVSSTSESSVKPIEDLHSSDTRKTQQFIQVHVSDSTTHGIKTIKLRRCDALILLCFSLNTASSMYLSHWSQGSITHVDWECLDCFVCCYYCQHWCYYCRIDNICSIITAICIITMFIGSINIYIMIISIVLLSLLLLQISLSVPIIILLMSLVPSLICYFINELLLLLISTLFWLIIHVTYT